MEDSCSTSNGAITYRQYNDETDLPAIMDLIDKDLSEPYSIFTYRYFLHQWPHLCYLAYDEIQPCGVVVCKMDVHGEHMRGYLAMLVVDNNYRGKGIGSSLAKMAIAEMVRGECEEVVLEAEVTNLGALALYKRLGFIRDKRLCRYYLSGSDAYRLKLLLPLTEEMQRRQLQGQDSSPGEEVAAGQVPLEHGLDELAAVAAGAGQGAGGSPKLPPQRTAQQQHEKQPRMSTSSITSDDFVLVKQ